VSTPTRDDLMTAMAAGGTDGEDIPQPIAPAPAEAFAPVGKSEYLNRSDVPASALADDWMPPDRRWPELNELRETHVRLRRSARETTLAVFALEQQFEEEDKARDEALKAGFAAGTEPDLSFVTADPDRDAQLKEARAVSKASTAASLDHIDKVIGIFGNRSAEFIADFEAEEREHAEAIRALEAQIAELRTRQFGNERTRNWMIRVQEVVHDGIPAWGWLFRWADVPVASNMTPAQNEEFIRGATSLANANHVGGLVPVLNPRRDEDGQPDTLLVPRDSPLARGDASAIMPPAAKWEGEPDSDEVELADLDHEDLVDWLMGTGAFDGEPRPTVADVIEVVGDDADPDLARRVLRADGEANGGMPRQGVANALNKIINKENADA
jgi:hypothetical protein